MSSAACSAASRTWRTWLTNGRVLGQRLGREIRVDQHGRQQIVEVVRHATSKASDRLETLGLVELHFELCAGSLCLALRADVLKGGQRVADLAIVAQDRCSPHCQRHGRAREV